MRISIELVPRSEEALFSDLVLLKSNFAFIDAINIPELLRYDMRSWEGARVAGEFYSAAIPHIRAIDIDLNKPLPMLPFLIENNIKEVLVIQGDPPQDMTRTIYPTETADIIWKIKREAPQIKVYAGIDQYRSSMRSEEYRIKRKIQAGADGFFTQPFYDMRYLEMYAELLEGTDVYWGVSPVVSERSLRYWETKNKVVFPKCFQPNLDWNIKFAKQVWKFVQANNMNIYFMPIKANLVAYLAGIFSEE